MSFVRGLFFLGVRNNTLDAILLETPLTVAMSHHFFFLGSVQSVVESVWNIFFFKYTLLHMNLPDFVR
jgi:hypothetical protein